VEPRPSERLAPVVALLAAHGLGPDHYVVIGGTAAQLAGWDGLTRDVDVVPRLDDGTLQRLADALNAVGPRAREDADDERGTPVEVTVGLLRSGRSLSLLTDAGQVDVVLDADGVGGYDEWRGDAVADEVGGTRFLRGSLEDVTASKRAANRAKDARVVPELYRLLDEQRAERQRAIEDGRTPPGDGPWRPAGDPDTGTGLND